jgi:hypothetical protein
MKDEFDPKYDILLSSSELRRQVYERAEAADVSLFLLSKKLGIEFDRITNWFNVAKDHTTRAHLRHHEIFKLCQALGFDIRLQLVVKSDYVPAPDIIKPKDYTNWIDNGTTQGFRLRSKKTDAAGADAGKA